MTNPAVTSEPMIEVRAQDQVAVVVPHTHWDREWYAPFETMRFHLVRFLDELVDTLEQDSALPTFLLDGQSVILEDYLEIRRSQRDRVSALVRSGRLRPGPFYVQPDEFHASGEALVRNLLIGCQVSREFGWVMREGYLPDTFGHVHQLPQILHGFGIEIFYAMRGLGLDVEETGSEFWWEAPDGSRVLVEWLSESYSNAAVLTADAAAMPLHHGALVNYDSLPELLQRLGRRSRTGVLLLLNGGDHLRVQHGVPEMVRSLDAGVGAQVRLGGLEEFHQLVAERPAPERVETGEFRYGSRHDVFDGIGSTRTPMKRTAERIEAHLAGVAERLDALATLADGRSCQDELRYAWRELVKNYAHDSICGCSVDEVHAEMEVRFAKVGQVARAVAEDALARLASTIAPAAGQGEIPLVVVNPSAFLRTGRVGVEVVPDLDAPLGQRRFGWVQGEGVDWSGYVLEGPDGRSVPFISVAGQCPRVVDALTRRKEVVLDRIDFTSVDVPALGSLVYRLVPASTSLPGAAPAEHAARTPAGTERGPRSLDNGVLAVEVETRGTLAVTHHGTGRTYVGLLEVLDDGDAGDEYGFGPLPGDEALSSRAADWRVDAGPGDHSLLLRGVLTVPARLAPDRRTRTAQTTELPLTLEVTLTPGADLAEVTVTVDNRAMDHRLRLRFPTGTRSGESLAESAFGLVRRDGRVLADPDWREQPSGACALRRFVAGEDGDHGLQVLTEGLYEYAGSADGTLDVTLLRAVGWMARMDHPLRPHKIGPELPTPAAQCLGHQTFRIGLRPYEPRHGTGHLYRAAERFSIPLQAAAVQGARPAVSGWMNAGELGLAVAPADVVLSAVKTAEDAGGMIVRVFNSADAPVVATLSPGFAIHEAWSCDLEERSTDRLDVDADGRVQLPLPGGRIATVRLTIPTTPEARLTIPTTPEGGAP